MNPPDEFNIEIDVPQPWNWKKIRRWMLGIFVVFVTLYEINMHRPWGEVVPGVRLEPLHVYTRADVTPGSFADLLGQAVAEMKKCAIPQKAKDESSSFMKSKARPWAAATFPELSSAIDSLEPTFALLEQASKLPTENCFLPAFEQPISLPYSEIMWICKYQSAKAARDLQAGNLSNAEEIFLTQLRFSNRLKNSCPLIQALVSNAVARLSYRILQQEAPLLKSAADFERLAALIDTETVLETNLAEILRGELLFCLNYNDSIGGGYVDPLQKLDWLFPFIGSGKSERQENLKIAYSHAIAAVEADPAHGDPCTEFAKFTEIQPAWSVYLRADPVTRLGLSGTTRLFKKLIPELRHTVRAERSLTMATLALYEHKLKSGNWPQQLADAMPTVPLDPFADPPAPIQYKLSKDGKSWELTTKSEPKVSSADLEPLTKP